LVTPIREQARADYAVLERVGYVVRDDLRPEVVRAWRNAVVGHGHRAGVRVDSGEVNGQVWAAVNVVDGPPDTTR
jgi:hypothetical protein